MAAEKIAWDGAPSQVIFMCPAIPLRGAPAGHKSGQTAAKSTVWNYFHKKRSSFPAAFVEIHFAACEAAKAANRARQPLH